MASPLHSRALVGPREPVHSPEITQVVAELAERVRQIERPRHPAREGTFSSGHPRLDQALPERGLRRGTLVEWLAAGSGSGAETLALIAAREAARTGGAIVVLDPAGLFYPPAAIRLGIELEQLIVVRPACDEDHAWALDQVLRTGGVAAVCSETAMGNGAKGPDDHALRRWQLAAETSGVVGLLARPLAARDDPSWAELRLLVEPLAAPERAGRNRQLRVTLLRARGGQAGRTVELELRTPESLLDEPLLSEPPARRRGTPDETRSVHLASPLAAAKTRRRSRRA